MATLEKALWADNWQNGTVGKSNVMTLGENCMLSI